MPFNKRNKHKTAVKRAIKRRLIEISIRVDGYIYKNRSITIEEAEKYIHEISQHQTKCIKDKHILQVIEKLTRCMKTIIGNTTKEASSHQTEVTGENNLSGDFFSESSPHKNEHEDINEIYNSNIQDTREVLSQCRNQKSINADTIEIFDSENEETTNKICEKISIFSGVAMKGSAKFNVNEKNSTDKIKTYNSNTITVNSLNNNKLVGLMAESEKNTKNLKPNETYCTNIVHKPNEIINGPCKLTMADNGIKIKAKKKVPKKQTSLTLVNNDDTKNFNIGNTSKMIQKPLSYCQPLNLETAMNANAQRIHNIVPKKNKKRVSQKNMNNASPNITRKRKNSINKNNRTEKSKFKEHTVPTSSIVTPLFCAPYKYKHTQVNVISNEVVIPMQTVINSEIRNIVSNEDSVTKQMNQLTIDHENVLNDLSWIEGIRYVREIGIDEFDQTPNRFNEAFWDNYLLPNSWKDDDFLY